MVNMIEHGCRSQASSFHEKDKLQCTSQPSEYEGGELCFHVGRNTDPYPGRLIQGNW